MKAGVSAVPRAEDFPHKCTGRRLAALGLAGFPYKHGDCSTWRQVNVLA